MQFIRSCYAFVAVSVLCVRPAGAAIFDFESLAPSSGGSGTYHVLNLSNGGVGLTLARVNNTGFDINDNQDLPDLGISAPATWGNRSLSGGLVTPSVNPFVATLSQPQSHVSFEFGDFGQDDDSLVLTGYSGPDATGQVLATHTYHYPEQSTLPGDVGLASIDAIGIQSFTFGGLASDSTPNSLYFDNITTSVPEPGCLALAICATSLAWTRARRRRVRER